MEFMPSVAYIYFVQQDGGGPIKIRLAKDVLKRLDGLLNASSCELSLLAVMPGDAAVERQMHQRFAKHHIRGEWFRPHPEIVGFIDGVPKTLLRDLRLRKRHRKPISKVEARKIWNDPSLGWREARSLMAGWSSERIAEAFGKRNVKRKGHDPERAREFGSRGGRPRKPRGISDEQAEKEWFDMRHSTNAVALEHMPGWDSNSAWRRFGASGRMTGPRRKIAKRKKRT
jgi:hypothetical protein